jgi:magnesium-protoporphyrin O-methyltransferase
MLISQLQSENIENATLLDIGGGVGAIQHELIKNGIGKAINVEASTAYSVASREEARRQAHENKIEFYQGDFVTLADSIPATDVVTLDRVICCYHDMKALVGLSSQKAGRLYGVVYPRDAWWVKIVFFVLNVFLRVFRRQFRAFIHPSERVETIVLDNGLKRKYKEDAGMWQVVVYHR